MREAIVTSGITFPLCGRKVLIAKLFDAAADARASILLYLRSAAIMRLAKAERGQGGQQFPSERRTPTLDRLELRRVQDTGMLATSA
jgi:hypothetical protein